MLSKTGANYKSAPKNRRRHASVHTTRAPKTSNRLLHTLRYAVQSSSSEKLNMTLPPTISSSFRPSSPVHNSSKFADTWTKQAKAMGYPSRAVFKLLEAQKKFNIVRQGDIVVDLGCSPGSWSKLSSHLAGGNGFVLGMDLTRLTPGDQQGIGVRMADIDQRFDQPRSFHNRDADESLLAAEKRLLRSRAPVGYMHQDVTEWKPGPGFAHGVDTILSDMAPRTTGVPSSDSAQSIDLCYHVIDLCSKLFKPPMTKTEYLHTSQHKQAILQQLRNDDGNENVVVDHLKTQLELNMAKKYKITDTSEIRTKKLDLNVLKKTLKQHAYLKNRNSVGIVDDGDENSAIYKTGETTLSQVQGKELVSTTWRGTVMMKVFQGEGFTDMLNILKQIFVSTYTFKPVSSRSESVEVFVICKGYCGPFETTRITNKHIRRPKTYEYLQQYKSNNKKRPQLPYDPTKHIKFKNFVAPASPQLAPSSIRFNQMSDTTATSRHKFSADMPIEAIYAELGYLTSDVQYTSDSFVQHQQMENIYDEYESVAKDTIARGISTNVHAAIKNASARDLGEMTPIQREISESDDIIVYQQKQFDDLFGEELSTNNVPTPEELARTMALYWDEGINFAKKIAVQTQTPVRHNIFHQPATVQEIIARDSVDALVYDDALIPSSTSGAGDLYANPFAVKKTGVSQKDDDGDINALLARLDAQNTPTKGKRGRKPRKAENAEDTVTTPAKKVTKKSKVIQETPVAPPIIDEVPVKKTTKTKKVSDDTATIASQPVVPKKTAAKATKTTLIAPKTIATTNNESVEEKLQKTKHQTKTLKDVIPEVTHEVVVAIPPKPLKTATTVSEDIEITPPIKKIKSVKKAQLDIITINQAVTCELKKVAVAKKETTPAPAIEDILIPACNTPAKKTSKKASKTPEAEVQAEQPKKIQISPRVEKD